MTLQGEINLTLRAMIKEAIPKTIVYKADHDDIIVSYVSLPYIYQMLASIVLKEDHAIFSLKKLYNGQQNHGDHRFEFANPNFPQAMLTMMQEAATEYEVVLNTPTPWASKQVAGSWAE